MVGQQIGHYKILDKLGEGGMGEVYRAEDATLKREVALKVLSPELASNRERLERFQREAETLAALDHPNIVTVYSVEAVDGVHFLTMELLDGATLADFIPMRGVPLEQFLHTAIPLTEALSKAHDQGVIHRDLKPTNVMVTESGVVKVLDFGLAKVQSENDHTLDTKAATEVLTGEGRILGTVPYMSPEQLKGQPIDHRSDIFSLGIVMYQAATGAHPFRGGSSAEVQSSILYDTPPAVDSLRSEMPHHVGRIIAGCLEKNPEQRFQSVKDIRNELLRLQSELTSEEIDLPPKLQGRPAWRRALPWIAAGLLTAIGIVVAMTYPGNRETTTPSSPTETETMVGREAQSLLDQGHLFELRGDTRDNLDAAEDRYRRALSLEPDNPVIQARLAAHLARMQIIYPSQERSEEIRDLASRVLGQYPNSADALVARGGLALLEGKLESAEDAAQRVISATPEDYRGQTLLGEVLVAQGRVDEGLMHLNQGVDLAGPDVRARLALASKLRHLGRSNEAAAEYDSVLKYQPDSPNALNNLGLIYCKQGRFLDAVPLFKKLLEISDDEMAAMNLANCYLFLDQLDDAAEAYRKAIEIAPERPFARQGLAEIYERQGNTNAARESYEGALESFDAQLASGGGPRAKFLGWRAVCAAKLGRHAEAQENIQEALEIAPDRVTGLFNAAQVYSLADDRDQAFSFIHSAIESGYPRQEIARDLAFESLRDDPDFQALIETPTVR